ncbi:hypothetical protein ACRCUN_32155 [Mycobacterium sp. LTG2003]
MTLHADMQILGQLGPKLQGLATEASLLRTGPSAGPYLSVPGGMEPAVLEAASIAHDLVDTTLINAVKERLSETGEIMVNVKNQFQNADDEALEVAMRIYTDATGDWVVPEVPR